VLFAAGALCAGGVLAGAFRDSVVFGAISPPPAFRAGAAVLDFGAISLPPPAFRDGAAVLDFGAISELPPALRISVLCVEPEVPPPAFRISVLRAGCLAELGSPPAFRPAGALALLDAATGW
jgi:hypothetical protein